MKTPFLSARMYATIIFTVATSLAQAARFSTLPLAFPIGSTFDLNAPGGICITANECTNDVFISNFQLINLTNSRSWEDETFTATLSASFVDPITLAPTGTASLSLLPGTFFTVRLYPFNISQDHTGAYAEILISASFLGADSNGNVIKVSYDPNLASMGFVGINPVIGGYNISNSFSMLTQISVNGTPISVPIFKATFATSPPNGIPEPTTALMLMPGLLVLAAQRRSRSI